MLYFFATVSNYVSFIVAGSFVLAFVLQMFTGHGGGGGSDDDDDDFMVTNPSTGLPMAGSGTGGVDVGGTPYGGMHDD